MKMRKTKIIITSLLALSIIPLTETISYARENDNVSIEVLARNLLNNPKPKQVVTGISVNLRERPTLDSKVIDKILYGTEVDYLTTKGAWTKISYEGKEGYISTEYLEDIDKINNQVNCKKIITGAVVNFREHPSTTSEIVDVLRYKLEVGFIEEIGSWSKIEYNGKIGFVSSKYLNDLDYNSNYPQEQISMDGQRLIKEAMTLLEKPYVWGAVGPESYDCSGFTSYLFKNTLGITLPRTSINQSNFGTDVELQNIKVGDLIFFDTTKDGKVNHVGMYIGKGEFIHASQRFEKVIISPISGFYLDSYTNIKRVIMD